jgi:hypothetical protein
MPGKSARPTRVVMCSPSVDPADFVRLAADGPAAPWLRRNPGFLERLDLDPT